MCIRDRLCALTCWKRTVKPFFFILASAARLRPMSARLVLGAHAPVVVQIASWESDMMRISSPEVARLAAWLSAWCTAESSPVLLVG